jgi:hypothetical protein
VYGNIYRAFRHLGSIFSSTVGCECVCVCVLNTRKMQRESKRKRCSSSSGTENHHHHQLENHHDDHKNQATIDRVLLVSDTLEMILQHLPPSTLLSCANRVCKTWEFVIQKMNKKYAKRSVLAIICKEIWSKKKDEDIFNVLGLKSSKCTNPNHSSFGHFTRIIHLCHGPMTRNIYFQNIYQLIENLREPNEIQSLYISGLGCVHVNSDDKNDGGCTFKSKSGVGLFKASSDVNCRFDIDRVIKALPNLEHLEIFNSLILPSQETSFKFKCYKDCSLMGGLKLLRGCSQENGPTYLDLSLAIYNRVSEEIQKNQTKLKNTLDWINIEHVKNVSPFINWDKIRGIPKNLNKTIDFSFLGSCKNLISLQTNYWPMKGLCLSIPNLTRLQVKCSFNQFEEINAEYSQLELLDWEQEYDREDHNINRLYVEENCNKTARKIINWINSGFYISSGLKSPKLKHIKLGLYAHEFIYIVKNADLISFPNQLKTFCITINELHSNVGALFKLVQKCLEKSKINIFVERFLLCNNGNTTTTTTTTIKRHLIMTEIHSISLHSFKSEIGKNSTTIDNCIEFENIVRWILNTPIGWHSLKGGSVYKKQHANEEILKRGKMVKKKSSSRELVIIS